MICIILNYVQDQWNQIFAQKKQNLFHQKTLYYYIAAGSNIGRLRGE